MSGLLFGLDERTVGRLLQTVTTGSGPRTRDASRLDESGLVERFARAAWSCIAEPGDGEAGRLVAHSGASGGLRALLESWTAQRAGRPEPAWTSALARWSPRLNSSDVLRALASAARLGARLVVPGDDEWPEGLAGLGEHAPMALWCRGRRAALTGLHRSIAIVGARAATGYGEHVALESSAGLVDRGFAIVSGAAYGIDGAAHRAALAGEGMTVAFLAGGVDRLYPAGHRELLQQIAASGAVLSELPCGSAPTRWRFLQRNRLIAAASSAVVVVEAGQRSGSLNTAGHAASLGRPLGAVPGPVTSPSSAGCHRLMRDYGAVCVTGAQQMAELTGWEEPHAETARDTETARRTPAEIRALDALGTGRTLGVDEIAKRAGLSRADAEGALGALALLGDVHEDAAGWRRPRRARTRQ